MPIGSKGTERPTSPIEAGTMAARIAVSDTQGEFFARSETTAERVQGGKAEVLSPERRVEIADEATNPRRRNKRRTSAGHPFCSVGGQS